MQMMMKKLTNMEDLPEEIVENILLRLPTKAVFKNKIVSKNWKSLICGRSFKTLHNKKSLQNPILILLLQHDTNIGGHKRFLTTVDLSGAVLDQWDLASIGLRNSRMLPSPFGLNNLLCFVVDMERFVMCNPSTRQICFPKPDADNSMSYFPCEVLKAGFGYHTCRKQYVIISKFKGHRNWQMITFSRDVMSVGNNLKADKWKPIKDSARYVVDGSPWGVFGNGILYWTGHTGTHRCLTCFNLCNEKFFVVLMPEGIERPVYEDSYRLVELHGDLHLMYQKEGQQDIELWRLDVPYGMWSKQDMCVTGFQASLGSHFRPLMMDEDGEMLVYNGGFMEWYNLHDGVFTFGAKGYKRIPCSGVDVLDFKLHADTPFL